MPGNGSRSSVSSSLFSFLTVNTGVIVDVGVGIKLCNLFAKSAYFLFRMLFGQRSVRHLVEQRRPVSVINSTKPYVVSHDIYKVFIFSQNRRPQWPPVCIIHMVVISSIGDSRWACAPEGSGGWGYQLRRVLLRVGKRCRELARGGGVPLLERLRSRERVIGRYKRIVAQA